MAVEVDPKLFKSPPLEYRPVMMWLWNGIITDEEIKRQLEGFLSQKVYQFFIRPMYGLESDYLSNEFFSKVEIAIKEAERLGMKCWIYDEYNWPSGVAGGYLIKDHPEYRSVALRCVIRDLKGPGKISLPFEGKLVKAFRVWSKGGEDVTKDVIIDKAGGKLIWRNSRSRGRFLLFYESVTKESNPSEKWSPFNWGQQGYLDTLNHQAVKGFIDYTYEKYLQKFSDKFGTVIVGAFTHEPGTISTRGLQGYSLPWTRDFLARFKVEKGFNLAQHLHELIIDTGDYLKTRYDYWRFVTDAFVNAYTMQLAQWCSGHEIILTGHLLAEEHLAKGAFHSGDFYAHLKHFQQPGIDQSFSKSSMSDDNASIAGKLGSSIAHQAGKTSLLCETYTGSGWHLGLGDMKRIFDWLSVLGVTQTQYMGAYYSVKGFRKNDDGVSSFAPSHSYQNSLWKYYCDFSDYSGRVSYLNSLGSHVAAVALLYPTTTTWCEFDFTASEDSKKGGQDEKLWWALDQTFAALTNTLLELQWDYDYLFEESFLEAKIEKGLIKIKDEEYSILVLPSLTTLTAALFDKIVKFIDSGGELLLVNFIPHQSPNLDDIDPKFKRLTGFNPASVNEEVYKLIGNKKLGSRLSRKGKVSLITTNELEVGKRDGFYKKLGAYLSRLEKAFSFTPPSRNLRVLHRRINKTDTFFVVNTGSEPIKTRATISSSAKPWALDPSTGQVSEMDFKKAGGKIEVALEIAEYGSLFIQLRRGKGKKSKKVEPEIKKAEEISLDKKWSFHLERNNTKRLSWMVSPTQSEAKITQIGDLIYRNWEKPQKENLLPSTGGFLPGSSYLAKADFKIKDMPLALSLVMEKLEPVEIIINDYLVTDLKPYILWDESNLAADIADYLQKGPNQIYLKTNLPNWEAPHALSFGALYGEFSINRKGELIKSVSKQGLGSWTNQGYPDYSGTGVYTQEIIVDTETKDKKSQLRIDDCVDVIELSLNGRKIGKCLWPPYYFNTSGILREGLNQIKLKVTNTSENFFRKAIPSGLLGEVKIILQDRKSKT